MSGKPKYDFPTVSVKRHNYTFYINSIFKKLIHAPKLKYMNAYYDKNLQLLKLVFTEIPNGQSFRITCNDAGGHYVSGTQNIFMQISLKSKYYRIHSDITETDSIFYIDLNQQDIYNSYFVLPEDTDFKVIESNINNIKSNDIIRFNKCGIGFFIPVLLLKKQFNYDVSKLKDTYVLIYYDKDIKKLCIEFEVIFGNLLVYTSSRKECYSISLSSHKCNIVADLLNLIGGDTHYIKIHTHPSKENTLVLDKAIAKIDLY